MLCDRLAINSITFLTFIKAVTIANMDKLLEIITIQPASEDRAKPLVKPKGVIVALHGWGSNANDLAALAPILNLPDYLMLFPQAPFDHPNVSGGRMWYDFQTNNSNQLQTSRNLLKAYLQSVLRSQTTNIPIFLLGFSQGGAMTLDFALEAPTSNGNGGRFAGFICLSGYLHPDRQTAKPKTAIASPVLIIHGTRDSVVPIIAAQSAKITLTKLGAKVTYAEFVMGHEINPQAIAAVRAFILKNS
jgi:phospholipase/carboxylesterase